MTALRQNIDRLKDSTLDWFSSKRNLMTFINDKREVLPYAYPCSNYVEKILSNSIVCMALQSIIDKYYCKQVDQILAAGQVVTPVSFPYLNKIIDECSKKLLIDKSPMVVVSPKLKGINALTVGSDKNPIILLSRKTVMKLHEGELKFLLGHEYGHVLQQNMVCHTVKGLLGNLKNTSEIVGDMLSDMIDVPLNQWYRCSEITADRVGLICCRNIDYVRELLSKVGGDLEVASGKKTNNAIEELLELSYTHPMMVKRLLAMEEFDKSDVFKAFCSGKKIDNLSLESLNEKVQMIMR